MEEKQTDQHSQEQPYQTPLRQQRKKDRCFATNCPWWRSSFAGYLICPFLIGLASIADLSLQWLGLRLYTTITPFYLAIIMIAWLWGVGPALLAAVLGYFALDIFIVPP